MLLNCVLPSRESILVDLGLDLLGGVRQVDGAGRVAGRHLRLGPLHCWFIFGFCILSLYILYSICACIASSYLSLLLVFEFVFVFLLVLV